MPVTGMVKCLASSGRAVPLVKVVGAVAPHRVSTYVRGTQL